MMYMRRRWRWIKGWGRGWLINGGGEGVELDERFYKPNITRKCFLT